MAIAVLLVCVGCAQPSPSDEGRASPSLAVPSIRYASADRISVHDGNVTVNGVVTPNGSPTKVVLEIGTGTPASPRFASTVVVADGLEVAGPVSGTTAVPNASVVCARFTATNRLGTSTTDVFCWPIGPPPTAPATSDGP